MCETNRKQAYALGQQVAGASPGYAPTPGYTPALQATDEKCADVAYEAPLRERVRRKLNRAAEHAAELSRIEQLLREHPEFEQFLELQRLINRHL